MTVEEAQRLVAEALADGRITEETAEDGRVVFTVPDGLLTEAMDLVVADTVGRIAESN